MSAPYSKSQLSHSITPADKSELTSRQASPRSSLEIEKGRKSQIVSRLKPNVFLIKPQPRIKVGRYRKETEKVEEALKDNEILDVDLSL